MNYPKTITFAFDIEGCHNQCRHCWLGSPPNGKIDKNEFIYFSKKIRDELPREIKLCINSWWREPDISSEYKEFWELEKKLSDENLATRFELLSSWRLVNDLSYAKWACDIGTTKCQLSFFGGRETTDWASQRSGSFDENINATKRLLDVGIKPRWQIFLLKNTINSLDEILREIDELKLDENTMELFCQTPTPDGRSYNLTRERINKNDLHIVPEYLLHETTKYFGKNYMEVLGKPESSLCNLFKMYTSPLNYTPDPVAFFITYNMDVYSNLTEIAQWWKLGNLRDDNVYDIFNRYIEDKTFGLYVNSNVKINNLCRVYGDTYNDALYSELAILLKWIHEYCRDNYRGEPPKC